MRLRAIILTGGRSTRFGGTHKPTVRVDGETVLRRITTAVADASRDLGAQLEIVVAGSAEGIEPIKAELFTAGPVNSASVEVVREDPTFGGPLAGIAAGAAALAPDSSATVLVLAGDLPFVTQDALVSLVRAKRAHETVAAPVDSEGYPQYLFAAWPEALLREQLAAIGSVANKPVRRLFERVELVEVPLDARTIADIDTPADLARWQNERGCEHD